MHAYAISAINGRKRKGATYAVSEEGLQHPIICPKDSILPRLAYCAVLDMDTPNLPMSFGSGTGSDTLNRLRVL